MTSQSNSYNDIQEGKPRVASYEENGFRTTTTTAKLGPDPNVKPKETVTVRKVEHPDSTETITVTEKRLPPIRYTETVRKEKVAKKSTPPQIQITQATPTNESVNEVTRSVFIPNDNYIPTEIVPTTRTYNVVRREKIIQEPNPVILPATRPDYQTTSRVIVRQTPEPTRTIIREPTPISYIQVPNSNTTTTTRIVDVRQPSPVVLDVATPPVTRTIINDNRTHETVIDDRRTLVNYQDDYYTTRRVGRRREWCGDCGCDCFDDCCGLRNCCRTNSFARRKDVVSYRTRVTKDGRRVRYRNADVPGYRCCNCCTGWCSRVCPCCGCLEWFCACPCWVWLCCLLPLLLALLGLSIGLLTQLPSISSNTNNVETLRVIEQVVNETWYIYGLDQPCAGSATTFPPNLSTITTLIPCAQTTTSWARIIQATTLITISESINSNSNQYNELRVTQSYNTVLAVLGENAVCQPDRNLPGTPLYCDQTTTRFSVTATSSSSTVYAVQVNQSNYLDIDPQQINDILVRRRNEFKTREENLQKRREALHEREVTFKERIISCEMFLKELAMKHDRSIKRVDDEKHFIELKKVEIDLLNQQIEEVQEENVKLKEIISNYQPHLNLLIQIVDQTDRFHSIDEIIEKFGILYSSYQDILLTIKNSNEELNDAQRELLLTIEKKTQTISAMNNRINELQQNLIQIQQRIDTIQTEIVNHQNVFRERSTEIGAIKIGVDSMFDLLKRYCHYSRRNKLNHNLSSSIDENDLLLKLKYIDIFISDLMYYVNYTNNKMNPISSNQQFIDANREFKFKQELPSIENKRWRQSCEVDQQHQLLKVNVKNDQNIYQARGDDNVLYTIQMVNENKSNKSESKNNLSTTQSSLSMILRGKNKQNQ